MEVLCMMNWRYRGGRSKVGTVHAELSLEGEWKVLQAMGHNLVIDVTTTNWHGLQSVPHNHVQIWMCSEEDPLLNREAWRVKMHEDGVVESWRLHCCMQNSNNFSLLMSSSCKIKPTWKYHPPLASLGFVHIQAPHACNQLLDSV